MDLTNALLPILEAGRLRVILSMDEQRFFAEIAGATHRLMRFNRISIAPTSEAETLRACKNKAVITFEGRYQELRETYRLSKIYS